MKAFFIFTGLLLALLPARGGTINFTQHTADSIEDGVPMRRMYFTDGEQRFYYRPLAGWTRFSDAGSAKFQPKDSVDAFVKIENSPPGSAKIPLDEAGLLTLRKIAAERAPAGATDIHVTWEVVNPTILQGWTSYEVGLDYMLSGKHFCRSILFINLDAERQIRFLVTAWPENFKPLYAATYKSLATWYQPATAAATAVAAAE